MLFYDIILTDMVCAVADRKQLYYGDISPLAMCEKKGQVRFMKHLKAKIMLIMAAAIILVVLVLTSENKLLTIGIIVAAALIVFAAIKFIKYLMSAYYKSTKDSYFKVLFNREKSLRYKVFKCFNKKLNGMKRCLCDVYIPRVDGTLAKADLLIINETGVWVVDVKPYSGKMAGGETDQTWDYTHGGKTEQIPNPAIWNKMYMKWFKGYAVECPNTSYFSYVVYGNGCDIKNVKIKTNDVVVTKVSNLKKEISILLARTGTSLAESEIPVVYDRFKELTEKEKAQNVKNIPGIQETIVYNQKKFDIFPDEELAKEQEQKNE